MLNESVVGNLTSSDILGQYFTFDELYGYCVDLARLICEKKLRIPCKFRIVKDNSFGNKPADDQPWTGMIGELVRHEVDLAIAPLTITSQRENAVDFSKPWMNLGISILIRKPEKAPPGEKKTVQYNLSSIFIIFLFLFKMFLHLCHHYQMIFGCVLYLHILVLVLFSFLFHAFHHMNGA